MATIYSLARKHRQAALAREEEALGAIARVYEVAAKRVEVHLAALVAEYERLVRGGRTPGAAWVLRAEQALALLAAIEGTLASASSASALIVRSAQASMLDLAATHTRAMLDAAGARDVFQPPTAALDELVGFLGNGSPLRALFDALPAQARQRAERGLIEGVARGRNPRETARLMRSGVDASVDLSRARAQTISRTETLRAHRVASIENYKANRDVVRGWVWLAACDLRTCASCWTMHGSFHDYREVFASHPNCRCSPAPQVREMPPLIPEDQTGAARFARLSEEEQEQILGPQKFALFRAGKVSLSDMSIKTYDPDWGPQRHEATVREAMAKARRQRGAA